MALFAVRCVYFFGVKADGLNVFEERVVAFEAASRDAMAQPAPKPEFGANNDMHGCSCIEFLSLASNTNARSSPRSTRVRRAARASATVTDRPRWPLSSRSIVSGDS